MLINILVASCADMVPPLTMVINELFKQGIFPDDLKIAVITPLHKGGDRTLLNNYHIVSVLTVISKMFDKIFLHFYL